MAPALGAHVTDLGRESQNIRTPFLNLPRLAPTGLGRQIISLCRHHAVAGGRRLSTKLWNHGYEGCERHATTLYSTLLP